MLKTATFTIAMLVATLALTSCEREATNTEKLSGTWKMTAGTIAPSFTDPFSGTVYDDYYNQMLDDCDRDDLLIFSEDGVLKDDEGATKCNTGDTQTNVGTWVWNSDETIVTATLDGDSDDFKIISLDEEKLVVESAQTFGGIYNFTLTATFTKQ